MPVSNNINAINLSEEKTDTKITLNVVLFFAERSLVYLIIKQVVM